MTSLHEKHIDNMCKIILATGSMVGYAYSMEFFIAWYGANSYEGFAFINRAFGNYWWAYWIMISCNVICPQLFWFKAIKIIFHLSGSYLYLLMSECGLSDL